MTISATASVFATTYAVGNTQGFAVGEWFDLTDFSSKEEFIEEATKYAKEELNDNDPELCFPDYEAGFNTEDYFSESFVSEAVWEILELSDYDLELIDNYTNAVGYHNCDSIEELLSEAEEKYAGYWDSLEDFGYDMMEELGYLKNLPPILMGCIDFEKLGTELGWDYSEHNGHYFLNY